MIANQHDRIFLKFSSSSNNSNSNNMATETTTSGDDTISITPQNPTAVVVFAHGLGDTAHGWADTMASLSKDLPHIKFVLPTAANRSVTINGGNPMHAWFDVTSTKETKDEFPDGVDDSHKRLVGLIEKEVATGIPHSRIVLGGFSQGASMALMTGYRIATGLAGVMCLSGFLPRIRSFSITPETTSVPLLMCHGGVDRVVSLERVALAKSILADAGVSSIDFRVYPSMAHSSSTQELNDIKHWLTRVLPAATDPKTELYK